MIVVVLLSIQVVSTVSLITEGYLPEDGSGHIIAIQHLPDVDSVCAAIDKGDVILWNTLTDQIECVGSVDSGLRCMAWSPDQELVVFMTGEETVIMMTKDFDPILEFPCHSEEFGEEKPITVGWGKKETQFHGSVGKPTAVNVQEIIARPAASWDDKVPRISWRGDGQFFVVSTIHPQTGARTLRVWSREGVLSSTSENVDGLEQALFWKPSGSLIASTQRKPHRHEVVFFERNGLRHGEFILPFGKMETKVVEVAWNSDSCVLALWAEELPSQEIPQSQEFLPKSYVQLWSVNNYHWYLKQQMEFPASLKNRVACFIWDPEVPLRLHIMTRGGHYFYYEWFWSTVHSEGISESNMSTVAVIDGAKLLLTPMKHMVVPPPMSAYAVELPSPASCVSFSPAPCCGDIAVLLSSGRIALFKLLAENGIKEEFKPPGKPPKLVGIYSIDTTDHPSVWTGPLSWRQLIWWRQNTLIAVGWDTMTQRDILCEIEILTENDNSRIVIRHKTETDQPVLRLCLSRHSESVVVELLDGNLLRYTSDTNQATFSPWTSSRGGEVSLPQPCQCLKTALVGNEEVVIGLTEHSRLYVNDKEVSSNCTSFAVHDEFLLLTTHAHTLRCISLLPTTRGLPVLVENKPHPLDENIRRVERGSRIVVAVTQDTKIVLQMPRGNLETIHPRSLVLSYLQKCLNGLNYRDAFLAMRRHRINLNLIHDHNSKLFLDNLESFINQVESVNFINLFLTDLKEDDVTVTMYADYYSEPRQSSAVSATDSSKVDRVCEALRTALDAAGHNKYLLSILTTYVKKNNPALEKVLTIMKDLKANPLNTTEPGSVTSEEALKYVLFLVDVNQMYDVALGMYDFELVLMVAEKSQKDPKEYLPFLNNLRKMETNFQRYSIDKYLKRYSKAIQHLSLCSPEHFEELVSIVKENCLFKEALKLYPQSSEQHRELSIAYGEHLVSNKRYEEAGLVFTRSGAHEQALSSFQKSGNWRQVFCMASLLHYTGEQVISLARTVAGYLQGHKRPLEASRVLEEYAKDPEEAIAALIDGMQWEEALRLMYKHERTDIVETHLRGALEEAFNNNMSTIEDQKGLYDKYTKRLQVVRDIKERQNVEFQESGLARDDTDLYSDTSSVGNNSEYGTSTSSRGTRSTGRSSKNRRKTVRKMYSLKEGSKFEDFALMEALSDITQAVSKSTDDVAALLKMLVLFDHEEQAALLQTNFQQLIATIETSIAIVWPPEETSSNVNHVSQVMGPGATVNSIIAAMRSDQSTTSNKTKDEPERPKPPNVKIATNWKLEQLQ
ncbi:elongator complex protein 1-like isoform X1 [Orbicella faveolata]|uniref:elongator complex protein 1-like isoform X1 n=1 Tax=Orbicella faveolata TaxID=48498 RepID=UPI0009E2F896|nr:elongator complex protein 1-like isoform X1 [Orbicella faveolata]